MRAITLGDEVGTVIALAIFIAGPGILVGSYQKLVGVWIFGFAAGRASWWTLALVSRDVCSSQHLRRFIRHDPASKPAYRYRCDMLVSTTLNEIIHAPNRLRICAFLCCVDQAEFATLRNAQPD